MARILVANKFYYPRGGDCIYTMGLVDLLRSQGHDVAIFAMQHPENYQTEWNAYFPSEINFSLGLGLGKAVLRPFGTGEVKRKFNALLDEFHPDIVHLNNIHTQLSPVIAELAHQRGIKVVWTLHDYKLLCPCYDCLRNGNVVCEDCFVDKTNVLKNKCMKNSLFASYIAYKEAMPVILLTRRLCVGRGNAWKLVRMLLFVPVSLWHLKWRREDLISGNYILYVIFWM